MSKLAPRTPSLKSGIQTGLPTQVLINLSYVEFHTFSNNVSCIYSGLKYRFGAGLNEISLVAHWIWVHSTTTPYITQHTDKHILLQCVKGAATAIYVQWKLRIDLFFNHFTFSIHIPSIEKVKGNISNTNSYFATSGENGTFLNRRKTLSRLIKTLWTQVVHYIFPTVIFSKISYYHK